LKDIIIDISYSFEVKVSTTPGLVKDVPHGEIELATFVFSHMTSLVRITALFACSMSGFTVLYSVKSEKGNEAMRPPKSVDFRWPHDRHALHVIDVIRIPFRVGRQLVSHSQCTYGTYSTTSTQYIHVHTFINISLTIYDAISSIGLFKKLLKTPLMLYIACIAIWAGFMVSRHIIALRRLSRIKNFVEVQSRTKKTQSPQSTRGRCLQ
jgi:hypothetical protein